MNKKLIIGTVIISSLLIACSPSTKTYSSLDLPYEIVNEEVEDLKNKGLEEYIDYQVLEEVIVRDLTPEENERFLERMEYNTLQDLNENYSAVEFNFGDMKMIYGNKSFTQFNKKHSNFIYNDELLLDDILQSSFYEDEKTFKTKKEGSLDEDVVYARIYKDFRKIVLIPKELVKKGLQFKTKISDEIVYIDIK